MFPTNIRFWKIIIFMVKGKSRRIRSCLTLSEYILNFDIAYKCAQISVNHYLKAAYAAGRGGVVFPFRETLALPAIIGHGRLYKSCATYPFLVLSRSRDQGAMRLILIKISQKVSASSTSQGKTNDGLKRARLGKGLAAGWAGLLRRKRMNKIQ